MRVGRWIARALSALLGIATIAALGMAWRLSSGPISLSFLSPTIAEAIAPPDASYSLTFEDTILVFGGWQQALDLRVKNLQGIDAEGRTFLSVPEMRLDLALEQLVLGRVVPLRFEALNPYMRVVRDEQGAFAAAPSAEGQESSSGVAALLEDLLAAPGGGGTLGRMEAFAITGGLVAFEDRLTRTAWQASGVNVVLTRSEAGAQGDVALELALGGQPVHLDTSFVWDRTARDLALSLRFVDLRPAALAPQVPSLPGLGSVQVAFGGTVNVLLAADGRLRNAAFDLWSGPGTVAWPGLYEQPVAVGGLSVRGRLPDGLSTLALDVLEVELPAPEGGRLSAVVQAADLTGDPSLDVRLDVTNLSVAALGTYWPQAWGTNARAWVVEHVTAGTVPEGVLAFEGTLTAGMSEAAVLAGLSADLGVEGGVIDYFPPMPPAEGAQGRIVIRDGALAFTTSAGTMAGMDLAGSSITIPALDGAQGLAGIIAFEGPLKEALAIAANPGVGLPAREKLGGANVTGQAAGELALRIPTFVDMRRQDVGVAVAGTVSDMAMPDGVAGLTVDQGQLEVTIEGADARIQGTVMVAGVPFEVGVDADMGGAGASAQHITLKSTLNDAERTALGLDTTGYVTGEVPVAVTVEVPDEGPPALNLTGDLTGAAAAVPELGWTKPAGAPASVAAALVGDGEGGADVRAITVAATDLVFSGSARIEPGGRLSRLTVAKLQTGGNDLEGAIAFRAEGGTDVRLDARRLDLQPYLAELDTTADAEDEGAEPFTLDARIAELVLKPNVSLRDVTAKLALAGGRWEAVDARGTLGNGAAVAASIRPDGAYRTFTLDAGDAGEALRAMGVTEGAHGGTLTIRARIEDTQPEATTTGELVATDFVIRDAPLLARMLSLGSFTGALNVLKGEGIPFSKAEVPFVKTGPILGIAKARALGAAFGITGEGSIDTGSDLLDLRGTLVPAYTVNSLLGHVPLIGNLLVGSEGSGVFAATYAVKGPLENPDVSVNALATLAPGFLREIFNLGDGEPVPEPVRPEEER